MLLPELFPIIISHIPLYLTPSTVLSLATVNKALHRIIVPRLLYSCIITQDEESAIKMILRLIQNPKLGASVREFYIYSGLSENVRNGTKGPFNVVDGLEQLITKCGVPNLHSLGVYLHPSWYRTENYDHIPGDYGQLKINFWNALSKNCPSIRSIILNGIGDYEHLPWIDSSEVYSLKNLSSFNLTLQAGSNTEEGLNMLFKDISIMSPYLHTLKLSRAFEEHTNIRKILSCRFPNLVKLALRGFTMDDSDIHLAMEFWNSHPSLQYVYLHYSTGNCFVQNCTKELLPNLVHLAAPFDDVRALHFLIHRLISLEIFRTVNFQVPYLFLDVLEGRLFPKLRRLQVNQQGSGTKVSIRQEGATWCLMRDGTFGVITIQQNINRRIDSSYISIMSGIAPNLEELAFNTPYITATNDSLLTLIPSISTFRKLERFYSYGPGTTKQNLEEDPDHANSLETFRLCAEELACACSNLELVVDLHSNYPIYATARIYRNLDGTLCNVVLRDGIGPRIGDEDEPFPTFHR
ncbi:hypothetical protein BDQ17DRAFT_1547166 [Cyathus striatus]|nr:hypothetical protein BDQ17DRAFT_1547166 [Cyathus striatus]